MRTAAEIKATDAAWVTESELTWLCEQFEATERKLRRIRQAIHDEADLTTRTSLAVAISAILNRSAPASGDLVIEPQAEDEQEPTASSPAREADDAVS